MNLELYIETLERNSSFCSCSALSALAQQGKIAKEWEARYISLGGDIDQKALPEHMRISPGYAFVSEEFKCCIKKIQWNTLSKCFRFKSLF